MKRDKPNVDVFDPDEVYGVNALRKEVKNYMTTRCNCDASCGENRYHDVGSSGCRFSSEAEYDAYWNARRPSWVKGAFAEVDDNSKSMKEWIAQFQVQQKELYREWVKNTYEAMKGDTMKYDSPEKASADTRYTSRPWGNWCVLEEDQGYKVKRLSILPDQAISLQYHNHRSEHWTIVQGEGKVIIDGNIFTVKKGESFLVPRMALHKVSNTHLHETLIAIEVQMGEICSEDDIVRC